MIGATVGAWPAVALVGSYELVMLIIRGVQESVDATKAKMELMADPIVSEAANVFADDLAAECVPSIRAIRAQLHIGQQGPW